MNESLPPPTDPARVSGRHRGVLAALPLLGPLLLATALVWGLHRSAPADEAAAEPEGDLVAAAEVPVFETRQLTDRFYSEGSAVGDLNGDGHPDIVSGPFVWFGPDFEQQAEIYPANPLAINTYSENFLCFLYDFNGNGRQDVLIVQHPGKPAIWLENPGHFDAHWKQHVALEKVENESPAFTDLTGNGVPDLICSRDGVFGYGSPDPDRPTEPWVWRPISAAGATGGRYTHGLGVGDITGDGRMDLVAKNGWWQQPESLEGDPQWQFHEFQFAGAGGAQMLVADFTGNGLADVVTSIDAHGWGLSLFRQRLLDDGQRTFERQDIIGEASDDNPRDLVLSQMHGLALADMDGDGVPDIVTGKRFWAHNGRDPGATQAPLVVWFQTVRPADAAGDAVSFIAHQVHDRSGVGCEVTVADVNGNGLPDIVAGNKRGVYVHQQSRRDP